MEKILVVDIPDDIDVEACFNKLDISWREFGEEVHFIKKGFKLVDLPEKKPIVNYPEPGENDYAFGYNDCLKDVKGV